MNNKNCTIAQEQELLKDGLVLRPARAKLLKEIEARASIWESTVQECSPILRGKKDCTEYNMNATLWNILACLMTPSSFVFFPKNS